MFPNALGRVALNQRIEVNALHLSLLATHYSLPATDYASADHNHLVVEHRLHGEAGGAVLHDRGELLAGNQQAHATGRDAVGQFHRVMIAGHAAESWRGCHLVPGLRCLTVAVLGNGAGHDLRLSCARDCQKGNCA